jgi:hypothetical protein
MELYEIRNAIAHPNRPFPDCYWYRLAAIANDPVIHIMGFSDVKKAFEAAIANRITLPPDDWFKVYAFSIPNNLPKDIEHDVTGLIGREKDRKDLLAKLRSKRFGLIALVGPGGTGKTAIALDVLRDASLDPATFEWADEIIYVTAKSERLTKDGPIPIDNPILSLNDVRTTITKELQSFSELAADATFDQAVDTLASRRVFICLDNLETLLRDFPLAFDEFYSSLPSDWRLLVTSRVPVDSATTIPIQAMRVEAATLLARNYLSRRGGAGLDITTTEKLVERTDCNPLAIRICVDGIVTGLDVNSALAQARENILEFSYTNLIRHLPNPSNRVLEGLFAANQKLTRSDLCYLLNTGSDDIAVGVQALLRTSLISRHSEESTESYSLSSSIRDLLLRNPLDEATRSSVFARLAEQESFIQSIQTRDWADELDSDFISTEIQRSLVPPIYQAFQMIRRNEPKARMADQLDTLRQLLLENDHPILYRACSCLLLSLNDRHSARQLLDQANSKNRIDAASLLMLAEQLKYENKLQEAYAIGRKLIQDGWFDSKRTDRGNLARLARVSWLVGVWLEEHEEVVREVSDWNEDAQTRAIKGSIFVTCQRRFGLIERDNTKFCSIVSRLFNCLNTVFQFDGYVGFVVAEATRSMLELSKKIESLPLDVKTVIQLSDFLNDHLAPICETHNSISIDDSDVQKFIERVQAKAENYGQGGPSKQGLVADPVLSQYGYIRVSVYARPKDSFGNFRAFLFARDSEGVEYHVPRRALSGMYDFDSLDIGNQLFVLPREDYDEGKARPVKDALPADD